MKGGMLTLPLTGLWCSGWSNEQFSFIFFEGRRSNAQFGSVHE